jgi:hypothetical protein
MLPRQPLALHSGQAVGCGSIGWSHDDDQSAAVARRKAEGGRRKAEGGRRKAEGGRRKAVQSPPRGCSLDTPSRVNTLEVNLHILQRSRGAALDTASAFVYGAPPRLCADVPNRTGSRDNSTTVPAARCTTLAPLRPIQDPGNGCSEHRDTGPPGVVELHVLLSSRSILELV